MRQVPVLTVLGLVLFFSAPLTQAGDEKEFFNGRDLTGWEGLKEFWSVKDGALVGHSADPIKHNTFLCSKKKYGDFELTFEVQILDGEGKSGVDSRNSGVQIRSEILNPKTYEVKGPQCDMGGPYWGSLYGEHFGGMMKAADKAVVAKALKKEGFNKYSIKCVGKHVTIQINDQTTVDGDFPKMPDTGIIAWQLHSGGPMTITFRNIQFKTSRAEK
jgi:hypothetical protein